MDMDIQHMKKMLQHKCDSDLLFSFYKNEISCKLLWQINNSDHRLASIAITKRNQFDIKHEKQFQDICLIRRNPTKCQRFIWTPRRLALFQAPKRGNFCCSKRSFTDNLSVNVNLFVFTEKCQSICKKHNVCYTRSVYDFGTSNQGYYCHRVDINRRFLVGKEKIRNGNDKI